MRRRISTNRGEVGVALALLAVAFYVIWTARRMPAGTMALPGPGFFPSTFGVLLAVAAVVMLGRIVVQRASDNRVELGHREVGLALAALVVVAIVFETAGAIPTLGLFLLVLFRALAKIPWWSAALVAAFSTAALWFVFIEILGVQLPGGPL